MNQEIQNKPAVQQEFYDAFISYGRKESKHFATKLNQQLSDKGYNIWIDHDDIPLGVDFQDEIDKGIERAHNFIFVIAPHAINSIYCRKEIELALKLKKRIIPILHVEEGLDNLHAEIGKINWLYMRQKAANETPLEDWVDIDDYENAFEGLETLLNKDKDYVQLHTVFINKALEWERNRQDGKYLLVGKERMQAEAWLMQSVSNKNLPTLPSELHCEYICESKKNAENLMTDVFISYASEHGELRDRVKNAFARHAITTWIHNKDIKSGQDFATAINVGIEQADNLVFFISNKSLTSEYCIKELNYALSFNKRIIPVLIEENISEEQPNALSSLQYIDLLDVENEPDFNQKIGALVGQIQNERRFYQQHKILLTQALKWERQERNNSILLRGYNLQNAQAWLKISKKRGVHGPVKLHQEFIEASTGQSGQENLEVFVSYSRTDGDFARKINEQLQLNGKTTWFDQESIATGSDFQKEIEKGIESADNFLFIISPEAIESEYCANEVAYASQLNKRFVTVYYRETDPKIMPPELAAVQWINFKDLDFHSAFSQLVRTLDTDREHLQAHTRWQRRAMEWQDNQKDKSRLLRGSEFALADEWLQDALNKSKKPAPTALQEAFIKESGKAIIALQEKEHKTNQRLKLFLAASIVALFMALGGGIYAVKKGLQAKKSESIAKKHEAEAKEKESKALQAEKEAREAEQAALKSAELEKIAQQRTAETLKALQSKEKELQIALEEAKRNGEIAEENALQAEISKVKAEIEALHMKNFSKVISIAKSDPTLATSALQLINKRANKGEFTDFIYDIFAGNFLYSKNLDHHNNRIYTLASSPDGDLFFSGGRDSKARVWNRDGKLLYTFKGHDDTVLGITYDPVSGHVFSGGYDKNAFLWDLEGNIILEIPHDRRVWSVATSHSGEYLATGTSDSLSYIWNTQGTLITELPTEETTFGIAFSPDDQYVLTAGEFAAVLWDLEGNVIRRYPHNETVYKAVFSPDGSKVLTGSWDRTSKLWTIDGQLLQEFDSDYTQCVDFAPSGKEILTSGLDKVVKVWDLQGNLVRTLKGHTDRIRAAVFAGDHSMIISGSYDNTIKLWPLRGQVIDDFDALESAVNDFDITKDGRKVAYASVNNAVVVRDVQAGNDMILDGYTDIEDLVFSPTGDTLVTAVQDKKLVFWDSQGTELFSIKDNSQIVEANFSHNGKLLVTANNNKDICIWTNTGKLKKRVSGAHMGTITSVSFSPNNNFLLSTSADKTATIWTANGDPVNSFADYEAYIFSGAFSPDGQKILLGGKNNTANLYDLKGNLLQVFKGHTSYVISCAFSPDGKFIATGSTDRSIRLWSTDGKLFKKITDHKDIVNTVVFSEDGLSLLSVSDDGDVKIRKGLQEPHTLIESGSLAAFDANDYAKAGILDITDYIDIRDTKELLLLADTYISAAEEEESFSGKEEILNSAINIINFCEKKANIDDENKRLIYKEAARAYGLLGLYRSTYYGNGNTGLVSLEKALKFHELANELDAADTEELHQISQVLNLLELNYSALNRESKAVEVKAQEIEILREIAAVNPEEANIDSKIAHAIADYAYVLMKTGKYAKAVEKMEQMLSLYPDEDWFKVRLASALLLNGELDKAGEIAEALIDKDYLKRTVIFNDEFENNEEAWFTGTNGSNIIEIENGYYQLEREALSDGWQYREISIDIQKDFEIETAIKIVRGVQNNSYTIDYGHDADEYNTFGFSGDGYFVIRSYFDEDWTDFKPWLKSPLVKKDAFNKLTIRKIAQRMYFFLNERLVHNMPFKEEHWFGDNIGFSVQDTSLMQVDYLRVSQLNTEQPTEDVMVLQKDKYPWVQQYNYQFEEKFYNESQKLIADGILHPELLKQWRNLFARPSVDITEKWKGLSYIQPDAAVYWPDVQKAYFFKGNQYVRFDLQRGEQDAGYPKNIQAYWPGVQFDKIDAACILPEKGKALLFSGNKYIVYDATEDKTESGYPKSINASNLPGVVFPAIDAAVSDKNGKTYFFYNDEYIRFDRKDFKADEGYPKKISKENWIGLEFNKLDAAIEVGDNKIQWISNGLSDQWLIEIMK